MYVEAVLLFRNDRGSGCTTGGWSARDVQQPLARRSCVASASSDAPATHKRPSARLGARALGFSSRPLPPQLSTISCTARRKRAI
eukprot:362907-Chlamydomonas_euryale.AAC.4